MSVTRRTFLAGGTAAGALLLGGGADALAQPLGGVKAGPSRASRLFPGYRLAHADLHNHSLNSDGDGDPARAFGSMRDAGLDVAALTDHATVAKALPSQAAELACAVDGCGVIGIDEQKWQAVKGLADSANRDGSFTSIRGFEWSSPTLGHMNVWFSETWTDPASTGGFTSGEGLAQFLHDVPGLGPAVAAPLDAAVRALPSTGSSMLLFHEWLASHPSRPVLGGGSDAIIGFNHPGREPGRFGYFAYDQRLRERLVSCEVFNRGEDYLFEGTDAGFSSPIAECLDAGWKVGLLGVTDEHGTDWGYPDGKGRTGLWVKQLSRAGVREAMESRRFFSTRLRGLRLDASMKGVRMGRTVAHRNGVAEFALDLDKGPEWYGHALVVQVLQTGRPLPRVIAQRTVRVPRPGEPVIRFSVPVDAEDGRWVVLRVTDPSARPDGRATGAYVGAGSAIAYASPFFLEPSAAPAAPVGPPRSTERAGPARLPSTGGSAAAAAAGLVAVGAAASLRPRRPHAE